MNHLLSTPPHRRGFKTLLLISSLVLAVSAGAQQAAKPAAPASAAKKELVQRVLALWHVEDAASMLVERPALQMLQQATTALQMGVPPDKREAATRQMQADVKTFLDETLPLVRGRAQKLAPQTVGVQLEEKFTEDELRQIIAVLESPVNRKFQQLAPEMQRSLNDKLVADAKETVDPRIKALTQTLASRLSAAAGTAPAKP